MQNNPLTRYLASDAEPVTLRQVVTSYGEHLLGEAASADLLFQVDDFAAAALCYRTPEQLVQFRELQDLSNVATCVMEPFPYM